MTALDDFSHIRGTHRQRTSHGMRAPTACAWCGTGLRDGARFCHACGAAIALPHDVAEYKQVTVLFADMVRSMDIAAALGAERLREVMTELFNRTATVVQHYGGTVDKFTGDGVMALFGAPIALEDHALRACLAALDMQKEAQRLAYEVASRDGIALQLRIGLNSGEVIAGEIGSGPSGYTAIGQQVGMAQRMESVAPPGGVVLSESTARLVQHAAVLGEREMVRIQGAAGPMPGRRLLRVEAQHGLVANMESSLVGRRWEMDAVEAILERAIDGHGGVVGVVGAAGIGKTRVAREAAAMAAARGVEVFPAVCESHAREIAFHAVIVLLRAAFEVADLDARAARERVRAKVPGANGEDLLLLDDLLGIAESDVRQPDIDPDARRRRLTALANAASLARTTSAVYLIEDAHWIDEVSESMLADFLAVVPQTPSLVLITYRPEYRGALTRVPGAQMIALAPLTDSESSTLIAELLGKDPSVDRLAATIAARAAGNPFFAQEIVRDLTERGVLLGRRGAHVCPADVAEVGVPATLQATIAARIDRLDAGAKQTLTAAAVVGSRFDSDLLTALGIDPVLDELVEAELIDQVRFTPCAEYTFHHPLIRTVAYESQLHSDRAELHRRLAAAVEHSDENAALIAEHLEAAGDLRDAYDWHMRAATWSSNRDIDAAWLSWERACQIADSLATDDPDRLAMRIAPRTLLCGRAWQAQLNISGFRFEELRQLCEEAGDKTSLAVGMTGLVAEHLIHGHLRKASCLASEHMALVESIGDPTLTVGLSFLAILIKMKSAENTDVVGWSQTVIDLADGDPAKGNLIFGSPLAAALASHGIGQWVLGRPGWRDDLDRAVAMAYGTDPVSHAVAVTYKYSPAIPYGVLLADDSALHEIDEALRLAEGSGADFALGAVRITLGLALVHRDSSADRERGLKLLAQVRDMCLHQRFYMTELPMVDAYIARETARRQDFDAALPLLRKSVEGLFREEHLGWCGPATAVLVETLLACGGENDVQEAETAVNRLAATTANKGFVAYDLMLLRLRTLLARVRGEEAAYRELVGRYRGMATSLGFEGHMAWAEAMT